MTSAILYSSLSGNTKLLAQTIYDVIKEDCKYCGETKEIDADRVYVGFWTNKGTADDKTMEFLKTLHNKEIFLFGTAGFGGSQEYFDGILQRTKQNIDAGNTVIGTYMCQGKMPISVRNRYEKLKESPNCPANIDMLIENFDKAVSHPDQNDLDKLIQILQK